MPGVTAKEVVEEISKAEEYSRIKIIYVTAVNVSEAEEKDMLKLKHVVGFIKKPFNLKEMIEEIKKVVTTHPPWLLLVKEGRKQTDYAKKHLELH